MFKHLPALPTPSVRQFRRWLCPVCAVLSCFWVAYERLIAPEIPVQAGFLVLFGFAAIAWITTSPTFADKYVGKATPADLDTIRIITAAILLVMTVWIEDVSSSALLPIEMRHSLGVMAWFYAIPGFESFVRSEASLKVFEWFTASVLVLGIIGWQTRIVVPLGAVCYLLIGGILRHYTWFFHTGLLPTYVMLVLSFAPCGNGLSVDRWLKKRRGKTVPPADQGSFVYGWYRYACWIAIALPYFEAGMSKVRKGGWMWWDPISMRRTLYGSTLDPMQFDWQATLHLVDAPDVIFALLGIAGVYGELIFITVLFSRRARQILPLMMGSMHIGILFLQNILFFDLIFLQLIFYNFTAVRQALGRFFHSRLGDFSTNRQPFSSDSPEATLGSSELTTSPNRRAKLRHPIAISAFVILMLYCWFYRVEFYPLTAMQMFTGRNTDGVVTYMKVMAHYDSGETVRFYPEKLIPALFDTRYRITIRGCFSQKPDAVHICEEFLEVVSAVHNQAAQPGEKLAELEIQQWRWNFKAEPSHPSYGDQINRYVYEAKSLHTQLQ